MNGDIANATTASNDDTSIVSDRVTCNYVQYNDHHDQNDSGTMLTRVSSSTNQRKRNDEQNKHSNSRGVCPIATIMFVFVSVSVFMTDVSILAPIIMCSAKLIMSGLEWTEFE